MKRKIISILLTLVLVLSFSLVTAVPVMAATLTVDKNLTNTPPNYHTIQAAINAAVDGDTINVAAGTYTEQLTITAKGLTITGESEAGVIVQAAATQIGTANVFTIDAVGYDITIQYMTIRYGDYGILSSAGNVNVLNVTLYHNGWDGAGLPGTPTQTLMAAFYSAYATSGGAIRIEKSTSSEIAYNTVYQNDRGIRFEDSSNGDIHDNVSHGNIQAGIYLAASTYDGATGSSDTNVYDNESYGNMNNGLLSIGGINNTFSNNNVHDNWNSGVMLWHVADNTIQNNTIDHNNLYAFNGQGVGGDAYGGVYAEGSNNDTSATFVFKLLNNTISNNEQGRASEKIGLRLDDNLPGDGIEVRGNTFINHDLDIHVRSQAATTVVNYNNFDGTGIGINNEDTSATLDATNNWWGDISGPSGEGSGSGDSVSTYVDFTPWLLGQSTGSAVSMTILVPDIVAISVTPTNIDFGTLLPGETSDTFNITVENIGTHEVDVDAEVSGTALFMTYLELRNFTDNTGFSVGSSWTNIATEIAMAASETLRTRLPVPVGYTPTGTETATLLFTATASP